MTSETLKQISVPPQTSIREVLEKISAAARAGAPVGLALVVDPNESLLGIATDGDFRRAWASGISSSTSIQDIMIRNPITVPAGLSDQECLDRVSSKVRDSKRIRDFKVEHVIVTGEHGQVVAVRNFFDLWQSLDQRDRPVCILGMGFVGLTLGAALADVGYKVRGVDVRSEVVDAINSGKAPFYEKGLAPLIKNLAYRGDLRAFSRIEDAISSTYIISVGTPLRPDRTPDLAPLLACAESIGKILKRRDLVILRSTVPVGTTRSQVLPVLERLSNLKAGEDFFLCFAPERTIEGKALEELRSLPQVIGGINSRSLEAAFSFFGKLCRSIVRVDSLESAEMVKLINNSFRDLSFAFSNELALICDSWKLDVRKVVAAANEGYPRNPIPVPSPGVGGLCLKKDPHLYAHSWPESTMPEHTLSRIGRAVNERMIHHIVAKVRNAVRSKAGRKKIFVVGFAFKGEPETSDLRDSTTVDFVRLAKTEKDWDLYGFDPVCQRQEIEQLGVRGASLREGFENADCVLFLNNHRSYLDLDIVDLARSMSKPGYFFDGWGLFLPEELERIEGVRYGGLSGGH